MSNKIGSKIVKGFSLIDFVIAIAVIGVLVIAAVLVIKPFEQLTKANDAVRKSDLAELQRALQTYYQENNSYPTSSADFKIIFNGKTLAWGGSWQPYLTKLPIDPIPIKKYIYYSPISSNGQTYYLYASLDRGGKDQQSCNNGNVCTSLIDGTPEFPGINACGSICNYGLSSPNVSP